MQNYDKFKDEQLVALYREGDTAVLNYICEKYKPLVLKIAKPLYLVGGETDDLLQEGMIGLFGAICDYDLEQSVSFYHFANLCIKRQIMKAIEASNTKKNAPLNGYVSIYEEAEDSGEELFAVGTDLSEVFAEAENTANRLNNLYNALSSMERKVFELYMEGLDYREIAQRLNKDAKSIDNTLTRIRQKAKKI
ncbi:MAG: sigma-70 family RNA polymerase sigma factor [Pseudobutyrivibrio sp.]|nr:sigma-70 family RNA polymerase sigma factor [Pseudobutyrivibrio sp.]